jgi:hypothetical protein
LKKRISWPWILITILGFAVSCQPAQNDLELSKFLIDSIQSQTIADSRVEVFSIKPSYSDNSILLKGKTTNPEAIAKLLAQLKLQHVEFIDSIISLPDQALQGKVWGLVTVSVANLRSTAAHSGELATQAIMGTPVRVLQEENGWFLIQTPDKYIAWTTKASIAQVTQNQLNDWKSSARVIYLTDSGFLLDSPDIRGNHVSDVVFGAILQVESKTMANSQFIPVILPDGRKGFISKADCSDFKIWSEQVTPDTTKMVKTAFYSMGRPYLWGGTSTKGFDCSGFTKTIYMSGGLILSRDASQQVLQGTEVAANGSWNELKSGDLLFVGRAATAELPERITHVCMYIGDSEFIHCSGLGTVGVNSLDSTRQNSMPKSYKIVHAKRMIGSANSPVTFKSHPWYN